MSLHPALTPLHTADYPKTYRLVAGSPVSGPQLGGWLLAFAVGALLLAVGDQRMGRENEALLQFMAAAFLLVLGLVFSFASPSRKATLFADRIEIRRGAAEREVLHRGDIEGCKHVHTSDRYWIHLVPKNKANKTLELEITFLYQDEAFRNWMHTLPDLDIMPVTAPPTLLVRQAAQKSAKAAVAALKDLH